MEEPIVLRPGAVIWNEVRSRPGMDLQPTYAVKLLGEWQTELEDDLPAGLRFMTFDSMPARNRYRRDLTVVSVN